MSARARSAGALLVAAASVVSLAGAQPRSPARADVLFREGREAMRRNEVELACEKFAESQSLDPAVGTQLNLSECEERLGHVAQALAHVRDAIQKLSPTEPRARIARDRQAALERRMARLVVRLGPSAPEGSRVTRDDEELRPADLGVALPVAPGPHALVLRSPNGRTARQDVILGEGETRDLVLDLPPAPPIATSSPPPPLPPPAASSIVLPPAPAPPPPAAPRPPVLGYVLGGVGVLGLVVSGVTGVALLHEKSLVDDSCDRARRTCDSTGGVDAAHTGKTLLPLFYGAAAVGVVGLGVGAYLVLARQPDREVGVALGPTGASLGGRW